MLYKDITQTKITSETILFRFNLNDLTYISNDDEVEGTLYIPSISEQQSLLTEYNQWCTDFKQTPNETLINDLNNLDKFKEIKLNEVKSISNTFRDQNINKNMYVTSTLGFVADADKDSQSNIQGLIEILTVSGNETAPFRDRDNVIHQLTLAQLQTLLLETKANGLNLFQQLWDYETAIDNAQDLDALKAIEVNFKMVDYSNQTTTTTETSGTKTLSELLG